MLFAPINFHGFTVPGMKDLAKLAPRKLQEVPGVLQGGVGWQGIVPARAAKMGSIAVDKAIAKLGTPGRVLPAARAGPDRRAHRQRSSSRRSRARRRRDAARQPGVLARHAHGRQARDLRARRSSSCPAVVKTVTDEIGTHIDQLLDPKIMVIDHFQKNPGLVVRVFKDFGQKELNMMVNFGFIFGFLLGIPVAFADHYFHQWWLLPVLGVFVGWTTNLLGMWLIFEPLEPTRILRHQVPRAVPAAAGRGGRGLRADHRRRRHHARADRRLPARRPARRPHPADARRGARPGDRQGGRPGAGRGTGGDRPACLRHHQGHLRLARRSTAR